MMIPFMFIRFQKPVNMHYIGLLLLSIRQLLLVWIGLEILDLYVLLIKHMLKFSMMLKTHNRLAMVPQP